MRCTTTAMAGSSAMRGRRPVGDDTRAPQRRPAVDDARRARSSSRDTLVNVSFMPAKEVDAVSSAVAEERTATARRRRAGRRRRAPRAAPRRACRRPARAPGRSVGDGGQGRGVVDVRGVDPAAQVGAGARVVQRLEVGAGGDDEPGRHGEARLVSSPRLAPLPPTRGDVPARDVVEPRDAGRRGGRGVRGRRHAFTIGRARARSQGPRSRRVPRVALPAAEGSHALTSVTLDPGTGRPSVSDWIPEGRVSRPPVERRWRWH